MVAPPVARKVPRELAEHGDVHDDDYYWPRDDALSGPTVRATSAPRMITPPSTVPMPGEISNLLSSLP